ncbi:hypothetical protein RHGRI_004496 [Rhododendron griersonianum]|uniref:PB1 domain-containing protein n=1 Tax=Rhododendron griersonianum TaxID=479676 RepID=A0AAV6L9V2_9ERIC|nr:hypothetical protein RHGRI_004496 [Rhododendron griersonianum]
MTTHPTELDSITADSPRPITDDDIHLPRVRFMCSFGGKILPRPHDNQLRYVGGDTRIVAVHRHSATYSSLVHKLSKFTGTTNMIIKYQLPNEDLDSLITVTSDEDVENMMDEYDRFALNNASSRSARLRLFLFLNDVVSRASSISSLLDGSTKREHWFLDALNGQNGSGLDRGRSEVSSIVSEVPDYLFGLDNLDEQPREPKWKTRLNLADNVSNSDPGSPARVVSSPFCSTSSLAAPTNPELWPVKTKPDNPVPVFNRKETPVEVESYTEATEKTVGLPPGYAGNPQWPYVPDPHYPSPALQHVPFYYVSNAGPPGNVPIHPVQIRAPFQPFPPPPGQLPVGYPQMVPGMGQVYGGGVRPGAAMDPYEGVHQPVYYAVKNAYPGMVVPGGEEFTGSEGKMDRVNQS